MLVRHFLVCASVLMLHHVQPSVRMLDARKIDFDLAGIRRWGNELRPPPSEQAQGVALELLRAIDILYAIGERDLVVPFVADLAEQSNDAAALAALSTAHSAPRRCPGDTNHRQDGARTRLSVRPICLS
jgi:hypothetical protein